nr:SCO family protein [Methylobacterium sp. 2A]
MALAGGAAILLGRPTEPRVTAVGLPAIGGPFRLVAHTGAVVDSSHLQGRPLIVFFGFTHCPDVCPTALASLSQALSDLGPDADRLQAVFVTVDPERDTQVALAQYMQAFDPRILALTGTPEEIATVTKAYKVFAEKVPRAGGDYTMNHTASVFLMDRQGRFKGTIAQGESSEAAMMKLRLLIGLKAT